VGLGFSEALLVERGRHSWGGIRYMIVKWNGDGMLVIRLMNRDFKTMKVQKHEGLDDGRVAAGKMIRLIPGFNDIPEDEWNQARLEVLDRIKDEKIIEYCKDKLDGETGEKVGVTGASIRRQHVNTARTMIKECFDVKTLNDWLNGRDDLEPETRDEMRLRIKQQLEKIRTGKDTEEEE